MANTPLLELEGVDVVVGDKVLCSDITLTINEGECHILLGPNGSGKSSLLHSIMGVRPFELKGGKALFRGQDLRDLDTTARAQAGLGMAFQRPPRLTGVSVRSLAKAIGDGDHFDESVKQLGLEHLANREVNCGFSGGESKRFEILKLTAQQPALCLLDEPESGVDLEQVGVVGEAVNNLLDTSAPDGTDRAAIVITHTGFILESVHATTAHLMMNGKLVAEGAPQEMFDRIRSEGYSLVDVAS